MTNASKARIKRFVDCFVRSEYVSNQWGQSSDDWINDPERAARCDDAAQDGADGSTHYEVIQGWRNAFHSWLRDSHRRHNEGWFVEAVNAHFDSVEAWHETNGSLHTEIG